jgi:hypothetical protein
MLAPGYLRKQRLSHSCRSAASWILPSAREDLYRTVIHEDLSECLDMTAAIMHHTNSALRQARLVAWRNPAKRDDAVILKFNQNLTIKRAVTMKVKSEPIYRTSDPNANDKYNAQAKAAVRQRLLHYNELHTGKERGAFRASHVRDMSAECGDC